MLPCILMTLFFLTVFYLSARIVSAAEPQAEARSGEAEIRNEEESFVYEEGQYRGRTDFDIQIEYPTTAPVETRTEPAADPEPMTQGTPETEPAADPEPTTQGTPEIETTMEDEEETTRQVRRRNLPKTGDTGPQPVLYLVLALICGTGYLVVSIIDKKHE